MAESRDRKLPFCCAGALVIALLVGGCGSVGGGIGMPLVHGISVGLGGGGVSVHAGAGLGPIGVGAGVDSHGQTSVGLGASTSIGGADLSIGYSGSVRSD